MSASKHPNDFPAIVVDAEHPHDSFHAFYLAKEPAILASLLRGDRVEAIRLINLVLVQIYGAGHGRDDYLKSLLLELVVMLSRAAIQAGASPTEVLGLRFRHLVELAAIDDDEPLAHWLRESVLRIFRVVEQHRAPPVSPVVVRALAHVRAHAAEPLTRDGVAAIVGVSSAHLGRQLKAATGQTFGELLREVRVERACTLLTTTNLTLATLAGECGFCDQSYLTHVFQSLKHTTPGTYRERHRPKPRDTALSD